MTDNTPVWKPVNAGYYIYPKFWNKVFASEAVKKVLKFAILLLSAKGEEMSKVLGLRTGADDYITKPFGLSEIVARVETLLRRYQVTSPVQEGNKLLCFNHLKIDREKCLVRVFQMDIDLERINCVLVTN